MAGVVTMVRLPQDVRRELDVLVEELREAHAGPEARPTISSVTAWLVAEGLGRRAGRQKMKKGSR